jgi:hypothetical protein
MAALRRIRIEEPPRHALSPGGSKEAWVIRKPQGFASAAAMDEEKP